MIELIVGILITIYGGVATPVRIVLNYGFDVRLILFNTNWTSTISGLYFVIRALDNIGKGLKKDLERARVHNIKIDQFLHQLIQIEAHKIWVKNGMPRAC